MSTATRRTLFELGADFLALDSLLEETGGELSSPEAIAAFDALTAELARDEAAKADGWIAWLRQLEMEAVAAKAERDQWAARAAAREARIVWIKATLKRHLEGTGRAKLVTASGRTLAVQVNGTTPVVYAEAIDPLTVPAEFKRVKVEIDRPAVEEALKEGRQLAFARLGERGTHLRVK